MIQLNAILNKMIVMMSAVRSDRGYMISALLVNIE